MDNPMRRLEHGLETLMFNSRWLLAPFYVGLVLTIGLLLVKFCKEFLSLVPLVWSGHGSAIIVGVLSLVDVALISNLLLVIVFAGYENFVSKIDTGDHEDRPSWMGKVSFAGLKIKLIGSIVAISAIELLKAFINIQAYSNEQLAWMVGIHMSFVFSGLLFAYTDRLTRSLDNDGH